MNPSGFPACLEGPCIQSASIKNRVLGARFGWRPFPEPSTQDPVDSGAVAQLGERLICIQEVAGSIPTSSTSFNPMGL